VRQPGVNPEKDLGKVWTDSPAREGRGTFRHDGRPPGAGLADGRPPAALPESLARKGAEIILDEARFVDSHTISVNGSIVRADRIIIAAGSTPVVPALPGVGATITSDELLFLPVLPRRLVIVGAGVIGLEMAGAFSDFGAEVVVVGQGREILPGFDPDVAGYLRKILESPAIANAAVENVARRQFEKTASSAIQAHTRASGQRQQARRDSR
jgi:glutathione reductase (NADPH)